MAGRLERRVEVKTLKKDKSLQNLAAKWMYTVEEKEVGAVE